MPRKKARAELLNDYLNLGVGIIVAIVITFFSISEFKVLARDDPGKAALALVLFMVTFFFVLGWIYFDYQEVRLYDEYMNGDRLIRLEISPFLLTLSFAVLLGFLLIVSDNLFLYLPVAIATFVFSAIANDYIRRKLLTVYRKLPKNQESPTKEICRMFQIRPFVALDVITCALLSMALLLHWYAGHTSTKAFSYIAHAIPSLTIILHEIFAWTWRTKRNRRILEIEARKTSQQP